jgi:hypothetical protein
MKRCRNARLNSSPWHFLPRAIAVGLLRKSLLPAVESRLRPYELGLSACGKRTLAISKRVR